MIKKISFHTLLSFILLFSNSILNSKDAEAKDSLAKDLVTKKGLSKVVCFSNEALMANSLRAKEMQIVMNNFRDEAQNKLESIRKELIDLVVALEDQNALTQEAREEKTVQAEMLQRELQRESQMFQIENMKKTEEMGVILANDINKALAEITKANPDLLILDFNHKFINEKADITNLVIEVMDSLFEAELRAENDKKAVKTESKDSKNSKK